MALRSLASAHPRLRFSYFLRSLTSSIILAMICLPAHGQTGTPDGQLFNAETATPMPGGHDYIHLAAETVNPSNGSVTIKFNLPMPKGRGITLPFARTYNSAGLYRVGVSPTSEVITLLENDMAGGTYPYASWSKSSFTVPPPTCNPECGLPPSFGPCLLANGFSFTDQYGTSHNLGLGVLANATGYSPTNYCPPAGGAGQPGFAEPPPPSGTGDGQVWAIWQSPTETVTDVGGFPTNGTVGPFTVTDKEGTTFFFSGSGMFDPAMQLYWSQPDQIEDRNGNVITSNIDTLGRARTSGTQVGGITYPQGTCPSCPLTTPVSYNLGNGNPPAYATFVEISALKSGETMQCTPYSMQVTGTQPAAQVYAMPASSGGSQQYTLYNGTYTNPDNPGTANNYGLVNELVYPDGGWVKYTWKMSNADATNPYAQTAFFTGTGEMNGTPDGNVYYAGCVLQYSTPVLASRTVSFDGSTIAQTQTFTYSTTVGSGYFWTSKQTQVVTTDNTSGNSYLTVYNYTPLYANISSVGYVAQVAPGIPMESSISYYSGSTTSTTLLRKVTKTWADLFDLAEEDTLENGLTSKTIYSFQAGGSATSPFILTTGKSEYDFGAGTATQATAIQYTTLSSNTITADGFTATIPVPSQPSVVTISNPSTSTALAETDYAYDGYSLAAKTGVVQHDDSNYGTAQTRRGNATSVTKKCFSCTNAVTTYTYDITGKPVTMKDPNLNTTTYSFTDSPVGGNSAGQSNAYLTQVTYPPTGSTVHQESFQYNYVFGDLTQSKDQNGQATNYTYESGIFDRLTESAFPIGQTNIYYDDSSTSPSVTTCQLIDGSASAACSPTVPGPTGWKTTNVLFDGMFHTRQTQVVSDPDGEDFVDLTYDGLGRKRTVSNPHRSASSSTDGTATTSYDVLGRPILTTEQDGSIVQTAYDQPCASNTNTLATLVTDEAGNQRRTCTDGLGRLVEVDEPGPGQTNPATPATGSFTISGTEQSKETAPPTSGSLSGGITVSGSERSSAAAYAHASGSVGQYNTPQCIFNTQAGQYIPPSGTLSVTLSGSGIQTVTASFSWGGGNCSGTTWTPQMSITQIAGYFASSLTATGVVTATNSGTLITITANALGTSGNYTLVQNWTSTSSGGYSLSFPGALSGGANLTYDTGTVKVIVDGFTASASYGSGSTVSSVAASLLSSLGGSGSPVTTSGSNPIGLTSIATGTASNYSGTATSTSSNGFNPASFSAKPATFTFTGGTSGYTYDTGTVSVTVGAFTATVSYGSSDTLSSVASNLANYFNTTTGSPVTAEASGATVTLTTVTTGMGTNAAYAGTSMTNQSGLFSSASFSASTQGSNLSGGTSPTVSWSLNAPYVTLYSYDALGNLLCVEQHGNATSSYGCSSASSNDLGNPYRIRRFTYDSLSRLLTAENPETGGLAGLITYTYDPNSNLVSKKTLSPNQGLTGTATVTTSYTYDADNRLTGKSYRDTYTTNPATPPVQYGYDGVALTTCVITPPSLTDTYPKPHRTSMCDGSSSVPGSGSASWSHDQMGRVLVEKRYIGSVSSAQTVTYAYNADGSTNTVTAPDGTTVTYVVGGAGRPLSAEDGSGNNYVTSATYAPPGELQSLTNGASIKGALAYNSRLQPIQMFYGTNTPPAITSMTAACPGTVGNVMNKTYDFSLGASDNGNVVSIANCMNTTRTQYFAYDGLNRISAAESSGTQWGETYTIDPWGNLTNETGISGKTNYEGLNAAPASPLNRLPGFGYDPPGNMTSNGGTTYVYDAENRLVWTSGYRYIYDGDGNRVEKCVAANATTPCPTSGTNGTLYWMGTGSAALDESDLSGNMLEQYVFFGGTRVARRDVSPSAVHYYFSDHLGTHAVVSNAMGTTIEQDIDYYPYGGQQNDYSTAPVAQHYKYTGKERDSESGLDNFEARYLGSSLGRFMSPDPMGGHKEDPQTLNKYAYVRNNPLNLTDPTGLDFNLTCSGKDTATCHGGVQGTTTTITDANGNQTSKFTATQIGDDGKGGLVDKTTNTGAYTASVGQNGVSFSQDGGKTSSAGVFANGTDPTHIQGSGDLAGFSFTFTNSKMEANQTAAGTFTFAGTPDQAGAALQKAGFQYYPAGENPGMNEYRSSGSFWTSANSGHFNLYEINLKPWLGVPQSQGDMHFGEHNPFTSNIGSVAHCAPSSVGGDGACH